MKKIKITKIYQLIVRNENEILIEQFNTEKEMLKDVENLVVSYGEEGKKAPILYYTGQKNE